MCKPQIGAMPWTIRNGRVHVVLVTSRSTNNWILPKGHAEPDLKDPDTAAMEAFEEAGVRGNIWRRFSEIAKIDSGTSLKIYPLKVKRVFTKWPEDDERRRRVVHWKKAVDIVEDEAMRLCIKRLVRKVNSRSAA